MTKDELRKQIKKRISLMTPEEKFKASVKCSEDLIQKREFQEADIVLSYMATKNELNPMYVSIKTLMAKKTLAFPRCVPDSNRMEFYALNENLTIQDQVEEGSWGILEPKTSLPQIHVEDLAGKKVLVIVPGLAFNSTGARLGRGAGFYDAYLSRLEKTDGLKLFTVVMCFSCQLEENIPQEEHDIKIDSVIYGNL